MNLEDLQGVLDSDQISCQPEDLLKYGNDWLKQWEGQASLVLFPKSAGEVVHILKWAKKHSLKLIPSGGRTGLSGGAVAVKKEVVVSFDKMSRISDFNPIERTVCVEAGCVTQVLQEFAQSKGLYFPISFSAQGSSQIGGNIATNAGGVHVVRYGSMRSRVLGLEVVTGRGDTLQLGRGLVKNATGYSLKELFIGSEGTLGFITKAILSLVPMPDKTQVFLLSVDKLENLLVLFEEFRQKIEPLAFEFFTDRALKHTLGDSAFPLSQKAPFYILIEMEEKDGPQALSVFEKAFEKGLVKDGILSQSLEQAKNLWRFRENISEAIARFCPYKNDVSVRVSQITAFLKDMESLFARLYPRFELVIFGHLGDGNLHINILKPEDQTKESFIEHCEKASGELFALIEKWGGSISAEHGVGLLKKTYLHYSRSPEELELMKGLKRLFDPDSLLNPGKIFDLP